MGQVYDVSNGEEYYGKKGSYSIFAGKDASRAFVTGCFSDASHLTHDLRGLSENQIEELKNWVKFYQESDKYFQVGTLELPEIVPDSPVPLPC
ncbi:Cytochrome b5-like heme/steroid binding domain-containing protein [Rozella allomycis CSF55]|uniref:Cytochrome b5-like heme/steroid binding domain-containing protein n=1 Tax=Rozella allomycis (strain CSF55) TaxID=988480 RepID=A0A075B157_ROZAC|nr:Cytochrome b5-like heme/steroid binding domain-containing protein [Rozella allomycis CSF55]|eukprot:EPZ34681.1 Cytochrome b5-like heme/steroid binding domain-containing protein [Rozella allomycis CSF55]